MTTSPDIVEHEPPKHRHHRRWRAFRRIVAPSLAIGSLLAVAAAMALYATNPASLMSGTASDPAFEDVGIAVPVTTPLANTTLPTASRRPSYGYSVIPGGVHDVQEFARAVERDPVVADHYRDVDLGNLHQETVREDRLAYVSYRLDDRVYWTKRKVHIRRGESILTDGTRVIRGRCGNCISMTPLMPTSTSEPDAVQFDALLESEPLILASRSITDLVPLPGLDFTPVGTTGFVTPREPVWFPTIFPISPPAPQPGPPSTPPEPPPNPPPPPTPIPTPEPGTLFLVGGGVAALVARHLRTRKSR